MKLLIRPHIMNEINHYIQKAEGECSGVGKIKQHPDGTMEVLSVYLPKQVNSSADTEMSADAMSDVQYESRNDEGFLNYHWHSHADMGVFWSGTDHAFIQKFGGNGFLVATVFNKKGHSKSCYYQGGTDFLPCLFMDDIDLEIGTLVADSDREAWDKNFDKNCKVKKYKMPKDNGFKKHRFSVWKNGRWVDEDEKDEVTNTMLGDDDYMTEWEKEWIKNSELMEEEDAYEFDGTIPNRGWSGGNDALPKKKAGRPKKRKVKA